jgi:alpha-beta hydrolase superfamily lysophospholipase
VPFVSSLLRPVGVPASMSTQLADLMQLSSVPHSQAPGFTLTDQAALAALARELPVYIAAGDMDPVNGGLTLLTPLTDRLAAAGLTDVTVVTYPGARHEIPNETNRDDVIDSIKDWTERVAG